MSKWVTGFPSGTNGKESACQCRRYGFNTCVGKIWRRKWQPTPVFLPRKSHGQRSLVGYSPWGHRELNMTEQMNTVNTYSVCTLECVKRVGFTVSIFTIKTNKQKQREARRLWEVMDQSISSTVAIVSWLFCRCPNS